MLCAPFLSVTDSIQCLKLKQAIWAMTERLAT